jgi:squalene-associated FAD-dependent desaturase
VLGGRARRIEYRGQTLDNGQHILSGAYSALLARMDLVGAVAADAFERVPLQLSMPPHFSLRAARLPAPFHTLFALLTASGLSWSERAAAVRFMLALRRQDFRVDADLTVTQLLIRNTQPARLNRFLWEPLTVSALNTPPEQASAQVFVNVLRDALAGTREASDLLLPKQDLSRIFPEAAAEWIQARHATVRLGETARRIEVRDSKVTLTTASRHEDFDGIVVAVGPHQINAIAMPDGICAADFLYEPIVTVYFHFNGRVSLPCAMLGQPGGLAQWFFDRTGLGAPADGTSTIAAVISATGTHSSLSNEQLVEQVRQELAVHVTPLPDLVWSKLITEKFATFACTPAAQRRRPGTNTSVPCIWLAGDYVAGDYPATLEAAVRSGAAAAQAAKQHFHIEKSAPP